MKKIQTETLIIGAGPAGMACAMELSKAGKQFVVIEKDKAVGGLAKTYTFIEPDGSVFYTDNGPHRFFSQNPYLYEFIGDILKEDWITVNRQTRQYIEGKFYDYPVNIPQALRNVGLMKACKILIDYLLAKVRYGLLRKPVRSFKDYAIANFGRTLGEFNMINYTEKIWGIDADEIHPEWAKQRIKGVNFTSVIKNFIKKTLSIRTKTPKSLIDTFYYPHKGTGQIYETIFKIISSKGYEILLQTYPIKISKDRGNWKTLVRNVKGEEFEIISKYLVESVPIVEFTRLLDRKMPEEVNLSLKKLRYRSQVYLFVTVNKDSLTKDQWIYFPAKGIPFGRLSEMKNFSPYMSPNGKTSIFIEFFCFEGDHVWNMSKDELLEQFLPWCTEKGFFKKDEIRHYYRIEQKSVYPIYDLPYEKYLKNVKDYLDSMPNLFFIGRPGRFQYNNQDHSLEMGILAARSIIDKKKYNIESVMEEKGYFEAGNLYESGQSKDRKSKKK